MDRPPTHGDILDIVIAVIAHGSVLASVLWALWPRPEDSLPRKPHDHNNPDQGRRG